MSTSTTSRPSNWMRVSIASRVVPATSVTITRSSPSSRFTSEDLPTFGRPIRASRVACSSSLSARSGQALDDQVEQVARAEALGGRHRHRVAEAEPVELAPRAPVWRASSTLLAATITGTPPPRSSLRQLGVAGTQARAGVHHEQREVRALERDQRLAPDLLGHLVLAREVHAAGVHQREADSVPVGVDLLAVARHAGVLVHDRLARAGQAVHERRLADVRIADHRDRRPVHRRARSTSSTMRSDHLVHARGRSCRARPHRARPSSGECSRSMSWASRRAWSLQHGVRVGAELRRAPACALLGRGIEEDLHRRIGGHDRPDVAALGHPVAVRESSSRCFSHERRAHRRVGGDLRGGLGHLGRPDRLGHVLAVRDHALAELDVELLPARSDAAPPCRCAISPTARYIAPESRYVKPSARAAARATVLLPAPAGPSMATTMGRRLRGAHRLPELQALKGRARGQVRNLGGYIRHSDSPPPFRTPSLPAGHPARASGRLRAHRPDGDHVRDAA